MNDKLKELVKRGELTQEKAEELNSKGLLGAFEKKENKALLKTVDKNAEKISDLADKADGSGESIKEKSALSVGIEKAGDVINNQFKKDEQRALSKSKELSSQLLAKGLATDNDFLMQFLERKRKDNGGQ